MKTAFLSLILLLMVACGEAQSVSEVDDVLFHGRPKAQKLSLNKLNDGTLSWEQPNSTGIGSYNGYCGETAWANIASMYLNKIVSPLSFHRFSVGIDATPGTQLETLRKGLSNVTKNTVWGWKKQNANAKKAISELEYAVKGYRLNRNYLTKQKKLRKRYPVIVLIAPQKNRLHWVTVVDIKKDKKERKTIFFNEYGTQNSLSEEEFYKQWNYSKKKGVVGKVLAATRSFGGFAYIEPTVVR